nr:hypothetical protein [Tanacetum cinerariifolium]
MRIPLLYRGEYSQWRERFMNYLEEQTNGEAMINSIQNGDQPLPVIAQVSLAGNAQNAPPTLKDPKFWNAEEKKTQNIDRLAISLLIQGLPNDIYSLIDSNETAKDLWDALERQMRVSEYGDVNDALGYKKKAVVVTSDPLVLVAEKTNVSKRKEKVVVSSDSERSGTNDFSELKKITALLAKAFNRRKSYSKPTNNNLRTSYTSQSANKKQEFFKSDDKKEDKKVDEKKRDMSKVKCYNCKKERHFSKDCKKAKIKDCNYYKTKMLLAKKDSDEQVLLAEDQAWIESSSDSDQEINANMVFMAQIEEVLSKSDESSSSAEETIAEVAYYTSKSESESEFETSEYYDNSTNYGLFVNNDDDQEIFHDAIESIADQEVLFDKMSVQLVELDKHVRDLKNTILEKDFKIYELEECVRNKDLEIEKCLERLNVCENKIHKIGQTNQTVHMIMPSKDTLYNGRKGICFENPRYFKKVKDLRPSLYDKKVIGLGYTLMFLTHSDKALEIEKFKRSRENKIEFAYDYGNLKASYVNEKINFEDDYFQEIKNPDFEKIDSSFQQTSSLKPYVPNVVKKECDKVENPNVIAPGMFKLSVSQSVSPMSMSKTSCDSNNVEIKLKRKRRKRKSTKQNDKQVNNDVLRANRDFVHFLDLDNFSSVRRPKHSGVIWKKKGSSNTSNVDLSSHMTGNRALLTNFVENFLGTVLFDDNDFAVIAAMEMWLLVQ